MSGRASISSGGCGTGNPRCPRPSSTTPAVLRAVRAILVSRGIRGEHDLEDAIGEVVLACIEYVRRTGRPPKNEDQAVAIARIVANRHGVGEVRKRVRRGKQNVGFTESADEHAQEQPSSLDPVDQQRMLGAIRQVLRDDQIEALPDVGAGVTQAQLAAESGAAPTAVRKRTQATRKTAAGGLGAKGYWVAGGFAALLAGAIAVYVASSREPIVAHGRPETSRGASRRSARRRSRRVQGATLGRVRGGAEPRGAARSGERPCGRGEGAARSDCRGPSGDASAGRGGRANGPGAR